MSKVERISPKLLKFGWNMRTQELDESLLRELGESMRVKQLQPIVVAPDYTVVVGHRRGRAALLIGLDSIDVQVLDAMPGESEVRMLQFSENYFREDASDWDKCKSCYDLLQLNVTWKGRDVANFLKIDPSTVVRLMSFTTCRQEVRDALRDGRIGIGTVYTISKEPEDRQLAMLEMKLGGASRDELEAHRRRRNRKRNVSSDKLTKITILLADGVLVVISGRELTTDRVMSTCGDIQKEAKKAAEKNQNVKTFEAVMRDRLNGSQ